MTKHLITLRKKMQKKILYYLEQLMDFFPKFYKITIDMDEKSALKEAEKMCQRLLANPVVHEYSITVAK